MTMNTQEFTCRPLPKFTIESRANLIIEGWDQARLSIESDAPTNCIETADGYEIRSRGHCKLYLPKEAELTIMRANSDVTLSDISGAINLHKVGGNLRVNRIHNIVVGGVSGNVTAENVPGGFKIGGAGGNLQLNNTQLIGSTGVGGNASFTWIPQNGQHLRVHAGGNIDCQLPAGATAIVNITDHQGGHKLCYGTAIPEGGDVNDNDIAQISLVCGGNAQVHCPDPVLKTEHFAAGWGRFAQNMERELDQFGDWFDEFGVHIAVNVQETINRNLGHALDQLRRQFAKAEWHAKREAFRAERHARRNGEEFNGRGKWGGPWRKEAPEQAAPRNYPVTPASPNATAIVTPLSPIPPRIIIPNDAIADQERLLILQMVADKKITVDQAEQLLRALA